MPNYPSLPTDVTTKLDGLLKQAGEAERGGDLQRSTLLGQEAWDSIPDPRPIWDFYPQIIARGMVRKAAAQHDRKQIETWLDLTYQTYTDPTHDNHFVNMLEGAAWRSIGDDDAAYAIFEKIYERDGREGFKGENLAYLEWLLKKRAERRG